jgi:uncharacterized protein
MRRLALVMLWVLAGAAAAELALPPPPDRRVNDYAGALSPPDRERLEAKLRDAEVSTGNQLVLAIFPSLEGESLEDYAVRLGEAWRVGQRGLDNGVIFLVFVGDRKMRLEVGYGLEGTLTDAMSVSILRDVVAPRLRQQGLADGIEAGLDAILGVIAGTYQPAVARAPAGGRDALTLVLVTFVGLVIAGIVVSAVARSARARRQGWTGGPQGWGRGGGGRGWPGAGFPSAGRGSSRPGGGGGFRGGGGRFGGGGASGSW